ncbi:MAG: hypothetical protein ACFFDH_17450 [Promethearchaeota archaeon]
MAEINKEEPPRPKGLILHSKAPQIDTTDIYDNPVKLDELLLSYNGVLIDFFRGNW